MPGLHERPCQQEANRICAWCVGNPWLTAQVERHGHLGLCTYCLHRRRSVPLESLADWVHDVMVAHFALTPDHPTEPDDFITIALGLTWEREGYSPTEIVAEEAGLEERAAKDVVRLLSDSHSFGAVRGGNEDPYDNYEARYEALGPDPAVFRGLWDRVPDDIRHRARFFNAEAERVLGNIFRDLTTLTTEHGTPVVKEFGSSGEDEFIWRARPALSRQKAERILESPAQRLGPPPAKKATAGRMNPEGIPVFYGAMDLATCIAEVRPPVGSFVIAGKFKLLKAVRILDMNALQEAYAEPNYFDPGYVDLSNRIAFLKQLVAELARPVMPGDEVKEYLATQIIAEYLAHKTSPRLDGILFRSSQMGGPDHQDPAQPRVDDRNVVLFNHASTVAPIVVPDGVAVEARIPSRDHGEDDETPDVIIWELVETDPPRRPEPVHRADANARQNRVENAEQEEVPPTLQLDVGSIVVLEIHRMKPVHTTMSTQRVRRNKSDLF